MAAIPRFLIDDEETTISVLASVVMELELFADQLARNPRPTRRQIAKLVEFADSVERGYEVGKRLLAHSKEHRTNVE